MDDRESPPTTHQPRRRRLRLWLAFAAILVALWLLGSWAVAYRLTHRNRRPFAEPAPVVAWGTVESHRFSTSDGLDIGAWFLPGRESAPSVLILHGNKGERRHGLGRAELLAKSGCSVLLISLRAHGDSSGEVNDIGLSARNDVIAAVEFLERRRPGNPIVILGSSLGSAAAIFAAKDLGHRVHGYILESPYQDLKIAVRNRTQNVLPPVLDWIAYQGLLTVAPLVLPDLEKISPWEAIQNVPEDVPVLILAGDEDKLARRSEAEALFDRVKSHGELHVFPKSGHLKMMATDPARYRRLVENWINAVSKNAPRSRP